MLQKLALTGAIALLVFGCKQEEKKEAGPRKPSGPPPVFQAVVAQAYPISREIEAPGTILPNESTDIRPEISGRVTAINFKEGAFVAKGTLLVKLFDDDLQAQLKKLEVQQRIAETTEKRQKELLAINGTSQQDYDNAALNTANLTADIELVRVNIERTAIKAPFSGRLGLRNISLGAYVTPQNIITNISQVDVVKAEFTVPEKYASFMQAGRSVSLRADGFGKKYTANIMASQNTIATDTRNLTVRAMVRSADANLTPGAFVQVSVAVGNNSPALMIPTQAVIPSTRFKKVIVSRDGKAVFQNVNTGFRDSARVEILDGINPGDTILTTGLLSIKEGQKVKVRVPGQKEKSIEGKDSAAGKTARQ